MAFISYAQNHEDVILARAFADKSNGFYIDIGACFPDDGSVTKHFYDLGWRGINVEPHPEAFKLLANQRSRDINLNIAIAESDGEVKLYYGNSIGETTALEEGNSASFIIPALSLKSLCEKYVHTDVDFLKVDVEGYEYNVLKSGDWKNFRPKVIVCEVTYPWSNQIRSEAERIDLLLSEHGYQMIYFDGLNNYFVSQEASALRKLVNLQPNVIDNFVSSVEHDLSTRLSNAQKIEHEIRFQLQAVQAQLDEVRTDREQIRKQLDETWAALNSVYHSRSWRITAPLRSVLGAVRTWRNKLIHFKNRIFLLSVSNFKEIVKTFIRRLVILTTRLLRFVAPGVYTRLASNEKLRHIYSHISRARPLITVISQDELGSAFRQNLQRAVQQWQLGERIDD